jgi:hypothetical protein
MWFDPRTVYCGIFIYETMASEKYNIHGGNRLIWLTEVELCKIYTNGVVIEQGESLRTIKYSYIS